MSLLSHSYRPLNIERVMRACDFYFYFFIFFTFSSLRMVGCPPPSAMRLGHLGTLPFEHSATWGLCHLGTLPFGHSARFLARSYTSLGPFRDQLRTVLLRNLVHVSNPKQIPGHFRDSRMVKYKWQSAKWQSANGRVPVLKYIAKCVPLAA